MIRTAVSFVVGAALVTGCLFPSFDGMQGGKPGGIAAKGDDNITETTETSPATSTTGTTGTTTTTTSTTPDASVDAGTLDAVAPAKTGGKVRCGRDRDGGAPVECAIGVEGCCTTIGGPDCQNDMELAWCHSPQGGSILRCDDKDDCSGSEVCCWLGGLKEAACAPSCAGAVLCDKANPRCPGTQACTGVINHPQGFTSSFCQ